MFTYAYENLANIIQIMVYLMVLIKAAKLFIDSEGSIIVVFFSFAVFSLLIADIYWVAYDILRPDARMPFAANEFGEAAGFLLLASVITAVFGDRLIHETKIMLLCLLFIAGSTALWIGWSGEWIQDIITGFAFGYWLCVSVMSLRTIDAFSKGGWYAVGLFSMILILCQAAIFFVPDNLKKPLDLLCYALMFTILAVLILRCIIAIRSDYSSERIISLAFFCSVWSVSTMYMSAGTWYVAAQFAETLIAPLMLFGVRKEVLSE